jgi:GNAT superfamily N-acetyltransferase
MPSIRVRSATADDASLLHALAAATFALACPPGTTAESIDEFVATQLSEQRFAEYVADSQRAILLVEADGAAVGYTMLVIAEPSDPDVAQSVAVRPSVELSKFYLLESAHGTGAAAALMSATVERARERGAASVWLGVNKLNARANRFYEKSGFVAVGSKRFALGGRWEDDFVRARSL